MGKKKVKATIKKKKRKLNLKHKWSAWKQQYLKSDYRYVRVFFRQQVSSATEAFLKSGNYGQKTAGWRKEKELLLEEQEIETKKSIKKKYAMTEKELERVKWLIMRAVTQIAVKFIELDSEGKVKLDLDDIPKLITAMDQVKLEKGEDTDRQKFIVERELSEDDKKLIDKLEKEFGSQKKTRRT